MHLRQWLQTRTGRIIGGVFLLVGVVGLILAVLWAQIHSVGANGG